MSRLQAPAARVISNPAMWQRAPRRWIDLCLSRLNGALRFSKCLGSSRLEADRMWGHVAIAAGRGVLRLGSLKAIQLWWQRTATTCLQGCTYAAVATGRRALKLHSLYCLATAARRSGHKPDQLCGKSTASPVRFMPVASIRAASAFL